MPSAEIITIGTEILLGEIVDTNTRYIARRLRDIGVDLFRTTAVGDNQHRIASVIREALERCEIVITTGGLGPTVDDPTREAVAQAFQVDLVFEPELWLQIQDRFRRYNRQPTENNKRQAYIPNGAIAKENPVGTAPIFFYETGLKTVIALPGVPLEMETLMESTVLPYLRQRYQLKGMIKTRVLHTAGVGESQIDDAIGDLELLSNPTVGLAAHSGQVDIRIVAKGDSEIDVDALIAPVENDLRLRIGNWIYGVDAETLEGVALKKVMEKGWNLVVIESGLNGELTQRLASVHGSFYGGEILPERPSPEELPGLLINYQKIRGAEIGLGVVIYPGPERQDVYLVIHTPDELRQLHRPYGGPPNSAPRWAVHHSLDLLRKL
jgi:nicotinamide-nucleotide amidase